jgi:hypothetical protein
MLALKIIKIYNLFFKFLASSSIVFCVLLLTLYTTMGNWFLIGIINFFTLVTILTIVISFLIYRYSMFLAERFYKLNKLALFSTISILTIILNPFIDKALKGGPGPGGLLLAATEMYVIGATSIFISSSLTYLATRLKNQFISLLLSIILALSTPFILILLSILAFRFIDSSSGDGAFGVVIIIFCCVILITLISMMVNLYIKINSKKIADRETINFAILIMTLIIPIIVLYLLLEL